MELLEILKKARNLELLLVSFKEMPKCKEGVKAGTSMFINSAQYCVILPFAALPAQNEEVLKKCAQEYLARVKQEEQRYQTLKVHAEEKLDRYGVLEFFHLTLGSDRVGEKEKKKVPIECT